MTNRQSAMIAKTFINAKIQAYNDLLAEIKTEGYTTISDINGALHGNIYSLEKLEAKNNEQ